MIENDQERACAIGKLFAGCLVEPSPEQIAIYVEATRRRTLAHLRRAVDHILATRTDEQLFPKPGELNACGRRYVEAERAELEAGRRRQHALDVIAESRDQRLGRMQSIAEHLRTLRPLGKIEGGE